MISSYGRWGDETAITVPPNPSEVGAWDLAVGYLPVAQQLAAALQDKYRLMLEAQRKLELAKAQGQSAAYIQQLESKYLAAVRAYERQREGEDATRQYRLLGQVGIATGIGLGLATIFFVLTRALR